MTVYVGVRRYWMWHPTHLCRTPRTVSFIFYGVARLELRLTMHVLWTNIPVK